MTYINHISGVPSCEHLFVDKYTNVDISCPFTVVSWYNDQAIMIAFGRYVNPSFTFKYGISESFDLMVFNFTDTDQGRYMCKGIANEEFKQHAVMVNLCSKYGFSRNFL